MLKTPSQLAYLMLFRFDSPFYRLPDRFSIDWSYEEFCPGHDNRGNLSA